MKLHFQWPTIVVALCISLVLGCATGSYAPLPKMPKYNTEKGRVCARRCHQEHTLATNACQGIFGGSISASQREQCLSEANQKLEECYGLCSADETDFKGTTQSKITFDHVLTFVQSSIMAMNKKNIEEITNHMADDIIIRLEIPDTKGKQVYNFNKAQYEPYLKEAFKISHDYKAELKDIKVDISSDGSTAKVTGKLVEKMTLNGRPIKSISGVTDTIEMRSGRLVYTSTDAIVIKIE